MRTRRSSVLIGIVIFGVLAAKTVHAIPISGMGDWETTLYGRDLDGDPTTAEAYYDSVSNITWLADANYAVTSGYSVDGLLTWSEAMSWVQGLDINGYGGWRLPTITTHYDYLCYDEDYCEDIFYADGGDLNLLSNLRLGNVQGSSELVNTGPFTNVVYLGGNYWTETEHWYSNLAWTAHFLDQYGSGSSALKETDMHYAWVMQAGDIGAPVAISSVPLPGAIWLFGGGLVALLGLRRSRVAVAV